MVCWKEDDVTLDHRHKPPCVSIRVQIDWSNPLLYWCLGVFGAVTAAVVLALA
jgi:hypothetical protein